MTNWIDDDLDLANFPKSDGASDATGTWDATDGNAIRQALLDIQTWCRGLFRVYMASDATKFAHVDVVVTSPNGTRTAAKGAIVIDIVAAKIWINTDGATTWQDVTASGSGTITGVTAGTGLSGGGTSGGVTLALANTAVTPGVYTNLNATIAADGRVTAASNGSGSGGGITNTAANHVFMLSDGTNAVTSGLSDDGTTVTTTSNRILTVAASSLTDAYPLYIKGPVQIPFTVTDNQNGEIFQMTLTQANRVGLAGNSDCFGVVIRNQVNYNNTSHTNACGGGYFEASGARTLGANALTNSGLEAEAVNGDVNYAFVCYAGKGLARFDDGALCGPSSVTGAFTQTAGNVSLLSGTNTCAINGATHITGTNPNLSVDGTALISGAATCNTTLRVNGANSNLAGGAGLVYLQSINTSGIPMPVSNAIAYTAGRYSVSAAADPTLGWAIATGTGTNLTLAAGTKDGQEWALSVKSGSGQVTPSALNGGTKYTWAALGSLILRWDNTGTTWCLVSQTGMTLV